MSKSVGIPLKLYKRWHLTTEEYNVKRTLSAWYSDCIASLECITIKIQGYCTVSSEPTDQQFTLRLLASRREQCGSHCPCTICGAYCQPSLRSNVELLFYLGLHLQSSQSKVKSCNTHPRIQEMTSHSLRLHTFFKPL